MTAPDLSDDYANAPHIRDAAGFPPRWAAAAAAFRDGLGERAQLGIGYGAGGRQAFDLFLPRGAPRGLLVFVHGGYWMAFGREDWSHLAQGAVARGWAVAMPSYTLAPQARIAEITREIVAAVDAAAAVVADVPLVLTGHSAGGHLVARLACTDVQLAAARRLVRVVPISPLGDLAPLMQTTMNATLKIDAAEAASESPARLRPRAGVDVHVWVGGGERLAFIAQAQELARAWSCDLTIAQGRHHFDVIDPLADRESTLIRTLLAAG